MINLIVAVDKNNVIGYEGGLPWGRLPNDLKHFKNVTTGHTVVMGRKTFESIGKPLPNRHNIVMSRSNRLFEGCATLTPEQLPDFLEYYRENDVFIIGGAEIYKLFLPHANTVYLTAINGSFIGDTLFPNLHNYGEWDVKTLGYTIRDEKNPYECIFQKFTKKV